MLKLLLAWFARDMNSLAKFIGTLETSIADFLAKHADLVGVLKEEIVSIEDKAAAEIKAVEATIASKVKAANILSALKDALPKG